MKSGNLNLVPADDLLTLDEPVASNSARPATHDDAFLVQQQKIQRLNEYYDQVVAELLTLLNESHEESEESLALL
jgi:hypothetical protein